MQTEPGMKNGIRIIKYLSTRRRLKHVLFWVFILLFFSVFQSIEYGLKRVLISNALFLSFDIPVVYIVLYFLWPRYFVRNRLVPFLFGISVLFALAIIYTWAIKYHLKPAIGLEISRQPFLIDAAQSLLVSSLITVLALMFKLLEENYKYNFREEENKKLRAEAELKLLRFQINPHFLFNTLISIQGLMYHNTKLADKMLTELSEFLRYTLRYNQLVFVPLKQEIEIIEKYLGIEKIRFGKKLSYNFSIEPKTRDMEVLCFLLQPLVENAIKHGMKSNPGGVEVVVKSELNSDWLNIEIINTGRVNFETLKVGTGIKNVKERLGNAYPDTHKFNIIQKDNWVHARIKIKTL